MAQILQLTGVSGSTDVHTVKISGKKLLSITKWVKNATVSFLVTVGRLTITFEGKI